MLKHSIGARYSYLLHSWLNNLYKGPEHYPLVLLYFIPISILIEIFLATILFPLSSWQHNFIKIGRPKFHSHQYSGACQYLGGIKKAHGQSAMWIHGSTTSFSKFINLLTFLPSPSLNALCFLTVSNVLPKLSSHPSRGYLCNWKSGKYYILD